MTLNQFEEILQSGSYTTPVELSPVRPLKCGLRAWWRFYVRGVGGILLSDAASRLRRNGDQRSFAEVTFMSIQAVESTGAIVYITGTENLKPLASRPRVYVANHSSLLETFNLPCILGAFGPLTIVAKRSLSRYPLFGACLRAVQPILLDRKSARKDLAATLSQGASHLAQGRSVLLFPQGTRTSDFNPRKFNSLGAKLAREAGVPLVPIACKTDFAQPGRFIRDLGPIDPSRSVHYAIGPVLAPSMSQSALQEASTSFIAQTLDSFSP